MIYLRPIYAKELELGLGTPLYIICSYHSAIDEEMIRFETKVLKTKGEVCWVDLEEEAKVEEESHVTTDIEGTVVHVSDDSNSSIPPSPAKKESSLVSGASIALSSFASLSNAWIRSMDNPSPSYRRSRQNPSNLDALKPPKEGMKPLVNPAKQTEDGAFAIKIQLWTALYGIMDSLVGQVSHVACVCYFIYIVFFPTSIHHMYSISFP